MSCEDAVVGGYFRHTGHEKTPTGFDVRLDELCRDLRDDRVAVGAQSSDPVSDADGKRENSSGIGSVGFTPSRLCVACQN